jgi:glutaredoxin
MTARDTASSGVVRSVRLASLFLLALALVGTFTTSCRKKDEAVAEAVGETPAVSDGTTGLLLTWIDDKGEFHVEQRVADVPDAGRDIVKVRDPGRDPLSGGRIFVVDLRTAGPDGSYSVRVAPSNEFEDVAVTRRAKHGIVLAPREAGTTAAASATGAGAGGAPGEVAGKPAVIIYGASWCGPCHQAAAYLKKRGVPFVEHDIEQDSAAAREMQSKLTKARIRGGSIPVLDVRGRILVGFDANAVDQALGQAL